MGTSTVDWFAQNAPAPSAGGGDWFAQNKPQPPNGSAALAPASPNPPSLTDNPNGEGVYQMRTADGHATVGIPYSHIDNALGKGYTWANDAEAERYGKDYRADPRTTQAGVSALQNDDLFDTAVGFARHAAKTVSTLGKEWSPAKGVPAIVKNEKNPIADGITEFANEPDETGAEKTGGFIEDVTEWLMGDEALKGMSYTERLSKVLPQVKVIEKSPVLQKAIAAAMQQGTLGGAQGFLHSGGNAKTAEENAVTAATTAGLLEGGTGKLANAVRDKGAIEHEIAGVKTPISGPTREAAELSPQQKAGQESLRQVAQDATERNLNDLNATRTEAPHPPLLPSRTGPYEFRLAGTEPVETAEGESVVPARKKHIGTTTEPGNPNAETNSRGVRKVPKFQYLTGVKPDVNPETITIGGGGEMRTTDVNVAERHLDAINEAIDSPQFDDMEPKQQQQLLDTRDDMRRQLSEYNETQRQLDPNFGKPMLEPADVHAIKGRTRNLTDFADSIDNEARAGYRRYDEITQNRASAIKRQMKDAWRQFMGASGTEAKAAGENAIAEADRAHQELMNELSGTVSARELRGLDTAYRRSKVARAVANAVDGSFSGNPSPERANWESWGFSGNTMLRNLNRAERKLGRPALEEVYGREGLNSLYEIAQANVTPAQRKAFGSGMKAVAENMRLLHGMGVFGAGEAAGHMLHLPWGVGGATAEGGYLAMLKVWGAIQNDPKVAQNLLFAIDSGANPKNYGPMIAAMIERHERQNQGGEQQ